MEDRETEGETEIEGDKQRDDRDRETKRQGGTETERQGERKDGASRTEDLQRCREADLGPGNSLLVW